MSANDAQQTQNNTGQAISGLSKSTNAPPGGDGNQPPRSNNNDNNAPPEVRYNSISEEITDKLATFRRKDRKKTPPGRPRDVTERYFAGTSPGYPTADNIGGACTRCWTDDDIHGWEHTYLCTSTCRWCGRNNHIGRRCSDQVVDFNFWKACNGIKGISCHQSNDVRTNKDIEGYMPLCPLQQKHQRDAYYLLHRPYSNVASPQVRPPAAVAPRDYQSHRAKNTSRGDNDNSRERFSRSPSRQRDFRNRDRSRSPSRLPRTDDRVRDYSERGSYSEGYYSGDMQLPTRGGPSIGRHSQAASLMQPPSYTSPARPSTQAALKMSPTRSDSIYLRVGASRAEMLQFLRCLANNGLLGTYTKAMELASEPAVSLELMEIMEDRGNAEARMRERQMRLFSSARRQQSSGTATQGVPQQNTNASDASAQEPHPPPVPGQTDPGASMLQGEPSGTNVNDQTQNALLSETNTGDQGSAGVGDPSGSASHPNGDLAGMVEQALQDAEAQEENKSS